jgi:hypothetical protein
MRKTFTLLGASVVIFGIMNSAGEARLVRYEINGKQYSYSTNNIAQTAEAKKRIAAAKAAEAKAVAEKSKFPLTAAFGSQAQKDAEETEKQLRQILAKAPADEAEEPFVKVSSDRDGKAQDKPSRQATVSKPPQKAVAPIRSQAVSLPRIVPVVAEPLDAAAATKLKSITFNVESGIRTIIKVDGTIEEEPFDSRVLSYLIPELENANSLVAFVRQLRQLSQEEATGSIRTSVAEPELVRDR